MENPKKDEYEQEDFILYNTIHPIHLNCLDDKDSNNSINYSEEKEENLNGRWNKEEHIRFIKGCLLYGNNWKKVKKYVKTRSSAQIRSHAQKYLIKLKKKFHSFDLKDKFWNYNFDNEVIENIVSNFNNVDMDRVEKMILYIFKNSNGNCASLSERGYNGIDIDEINFNDYSFSDKEIKNKKKEKIFKICKISKDKKEFDLIEKNNNIESFTGKKRTMNKIDYSELYNNINGINNFGIEPFKMIQIEKFINNCLDSNDPTDLTKLLLFFEQSNYMFNPMNFIDANLLYNQNRERDMYNTMKACLNESYNNQNTDVKTPSSDSIDNEKQKNINLNYQQTIALEIAKINPNFEHLYPNTLNGMFNNYNFIPFQNTLPINQFLIDNRFHNFNG
jgi:SHAQKYF class myb-like DNA-binding protein